MHTVACTVQGSFVCATILCRLKNKRKWNYSFPQPVWPQMLMSVFKKKKKSGKQKEIEV